MKVSLILASLGLGAIAFGLSPARGVSGPSLSRAELAASVGGECDGCEAGWQTTSQILGGGECEHGPEHDNSAACVAARAAGTVSCKEQNPAGNCECFKCQGIPFQDPYSITCEPEIRVWIAWCGADGSPADKAEDEECETEADPNSANDSLREERPSAVVGGGVCSGSNGDHETVRSCGDPGNFPGGAFACKAGNCAGQGAWAAVSTGQRSRCKA